MVKIKAIKRTFLQYFIVPYHTFHRNLHFHAWQCFYLDLSKAFFQSEHQNLE